MYLASDFDVYVRVFTYIKFYTEGFSYSSITISRSVDLSAFHHCGHTLLRIFYTYVRKSHNLAHGRVKCTWSKWQVVYLGKLNDPRFIGGRKELKKDFPSIWRAEIVCETRCSQVEKDARKKKNVLMAERENGEEKKRKTECELWIYITAGDLFHLDSGYLGGVL